MRQKHGSDSSCFLGACICGEKSDSCQVFVATEICRRCLTLLYAHISPVVAAHLERKTSSRSKYAEGRRMGVGDGLLELTFFRLGCVGLW